MANDVKKYRNLIESAESNKIYEAEDSGDGMDIESYMGGYQKDWIVYDFEMSNLLCISLHKEDDESDWKLIEWVNFSNENSEKIIETLSMGYHTMFLASSYRDGYEWVIGKHQYKPEELVEDDYFSNLISSDDIWGKSALNIEVDKEEFENKLEEYFSENDIMYSGGTFDK